MRISPPPIPNPSAKLAAGTLGSKLLQLATVAAAIHRAQSITPAPKEAK